MLLPLPDEASRLPMVSAIRGHRRSNPIRSTNWHPDRIEWNACNSSIPAASFPARVVNQNTPASSKSQTIQPKPVPLLAGADPAGDRAPPARIHHHPDMLQVALSSVEKYYTKR
jgi:hypothetical protein